MKKITAILLIISITMFCACSTKQTSETTTTPTKKTDIIDTKTKIDPNSIPRPYTSDKIFYSKEIIADPADPYSTFLKSRCEEYKRIWNKRLSLYDDLQDNFDTFVNSFQNIFYFLYDLDGDRTNELLLGSLSSVGWDEDDSKAIYITVVYGLENGKVKRLSNLDWWNNFYLWNRVLLENGSILTTYGNEYNPNFYSYALENGKFVLKCDATVADNSITKYNVKYSFDDKGREISQEEARRLYNSIIGESKKVDIKWKCIDEYGM